MGAKTEGSYSPCQPQSPAVRRVLVGAPARRATGRPWRGCRGRGTPAMQPMAEILGQTSRWRAISRTPVPPAASRIVLARSDSFAVSHGRGPSGSALALPQRLSRSDRQTDAASGPQRIGGQSDDSPCHVRKHLTPPYRAYAHRHLNFLPNRGNPDSPQPLWSRHFRRAALGFRLGLPVKSPTLDQMIADLFSVKDRLWDERIPDMILGYFDDVRLALNSLDAILKPGGRVIMVVGDSQYAGVYVDVAATIAELIEDIGFKLTTRKAIRSMRSSAQHGGRHELSESFLILDRV